ncbi:MAG: reverse transcriptase domain-containing protein, partial [Chloroflexota bacterium]|nr:reverse transcriptase domain-containing protein [Chloroflexota bacterium]
MISPLLANIALHGLETTIVAAYSVGKKPTVVRYADDFVVMHEDVGVIGEIQERTNEWLSCLGLELKPSKTQIVHTLQAHEGRPGFDFLGFEVCQHRVGKNRSGKNAQGRLLGFKTIIRPSKEGQRRHLEAIEAVVKANRDAPQDALVSRLNPVVSGWANYYSSVASKATFARMDAGTYLKLLRWANRRHPKKNKAWVAHKYWRLETSGWTFGTKQGIKLYRHSRTPIRRHAKVRGTKSPYDGDWVYWATRTGKHPELPRRVATLLSWQKGRCARCGLYFKTEDLPEVDHIIPSENGG